MVLDVRKTGTSRREEEGILNGLPAGWNAVGALGKVRTMWHGCLNRGKIGKADDVTVDEEDKVVKNAAIIY